jgi:hypothetical protein
MTGALEDEMLRLGAPPEMHTRAREIDRSRTEAQDLLQQLDCMQERLLAKAAARRHDVGS